MNRIIIIIINIIIKALIHLCMENHFLMKVKRQPSVNQNNKQSWASSALLINHLYRVYTSFTNTHLTIPSVHVLEYIMHGLKYFEN